MKIGEEEVPEGLAILVPTSILNGLKLYIEEGVPTGDFLAAVLDNNLCEAFGRADEYSARAMKFIAQLLYNYTPSDCWGSPEKRLAWIERGGLKQSWIPAVPGYGVRA